MWLRAMGAWLLAACVAVPASGGVIILKDGTKKEVRIYKKTERYVSYLEDGTIKVLPLEKVKELKLGDKPLTKEELAKAIKAHREKLKKTVEAKKKKEGDKKPAPEVKDLTADKDPGKGVKIIKKNRSKTKATELMIDPFPDEPVKDRKNKKRAPAPAKPKPSDARKDKAAEKPGRSAEK
jgi:hypothetical protein